MAPMSTSILPQAAFSDTENQAFDELFDDADIERLVDALFPDELTRVGGAAQSPAARSALLSKRPPAGAPRS